MAVKKNENTEAPEGYTPRLPSVNLLPEDIREVIKVESAYRWLAVIAVVVVVALGGAFVWKQGDVSAANRNLAAANNQHTTLTSAQEKLDPVGAFYAGVAENQQAIQQAMGKEVLFSDLAVRLRNDSPAGVTIDTASLSADTDASGALNGTAPAAGSCPSPNPFQPSSAVGCVIISGKAATRDQVGALLNNLNTDDRFTGAFVSSTTTDEQTGAISFTATVGLTDNVFSNRYQDVNFLKEGEQE